MSDNYTSPCDHTKPYEAWQSAVAQGLTKKGFEEYLKYLQDFRPQQEQQLKNTFCDPLAPSREDARRLVQELEELRRNYELQKEATTNKKK